MDEPQRKRVPEQTVACIEHIGPYAEIGGVYHQLYQWAAKAGVPPQGQAFTVFLASPEGMDWSSGHFEVCLPVPEGTEAEGDVRTKVLPATDVLYAVVEGPYDELPAHYAEFLAWASWENVSFTGHPREIYHVHPGSDGAADPSAYRTEIQFPVGSE